MTIASIRRQYVEANVVAKLGANAGISLAADHVRLEHCPQAKCVPPVGSW